jgi:hypothetical protein
MALFDNLTEENFLHYAARHYQNKSCLDVQEFHDDVARFKYLKRLLRKYRDGALLQERLILNHIIIIHNVFSIEHGKKMCFFKMEEDLWSTLKTFMIYLNYLREDEYVEVPLDLKIVDILRKL